MVSTPPPNAAAANTATTGYSAHRPLRAAREQRTRTPIQIASVSRAGGQTQPAAVRAPSPGARISSPDPVTAIAAAGTKAQRWGWLVIRIDSTASIAQPSAKPRSADPVMAYSPAPANTTRVRTAAAPSPVTSDPAMIRRMGPVRGWRGGAAGPPAGVGGGRVGCVVIAMTGRLP